MPLETDKWDRKCPLAHELRTYELATFLRYASEITSLTDWEQDFCRSLSRHLTYQSPTAGQRAVLDRGLLRKLWQNDPRLWD